MTDQPQLSAADLDGMTPEDIVTARHAGRLDALLGVPSEDVAVLDRARAGQAITRDDVAHLARLGRHDLIVEAAQTDRITD